MLAARHLDGSAMKPVPVGAGAEQGKRPYPVGCVAACAKADARTRDKMAECMTMMERCARCAEGERDCAALEGKTGERL